MNVTSTASTSRMPATPRIVSAGSPTSSASRISASSASVRVIMAALEGLLMGSRGGRGRRGAGRALLPHWCREIQRDVGVDDEAARRIQHERQVLVRRDLLDRRADLADDVPRHLLVRLRGFALRAPDVLHEPLVVADRALQLFLTLVPLDRRQDGREVVDLVAQLLDGVLLLARLVAPALHLAVEALLRVLRFLVVPEDASRIDVADANVRRAHGSGKREQRE